MTQGLNINIKTVFVDSFLADNLRSHYSSIKKYKMNCSASEVYLNDRIK